MEPNPSKLRRHGNPTRSSLAKLTRTPTVVLHTYARTIHPVLLIRVWVPRNFDGSNFSYPTPILFYFSSGKTIAQATDNVVLMAQYLDALRIGAHRTSLSPARELDFVSRHSADEKPPPNPLDTSLKSLESRHGQRD